MQIQWKYYIIAFLMHIVCSNVSAKIRPDTLMLNRIYKYAETIDTTEINHSYTYSYQLSLIDVEKRNFTLLAVPSMYVIAHGGDRKYISETYDQVSFHDFRKFESRRMVTLTTIPHHRKTLPILMKYLTPLIYNETIIEDHLLSPFNKHNHIFYRYKVSFYLNGTARITFRPRCNNTQLVRGYALVDYSTGRIIDTQIEGEYDMINFILHITMGKDGVKSLLPIKCNLTSQFKFIGNKINIKYYAYYDLPKILNDTIYNVENIELMKQVRPDTISDVEQQIYNKHYTKKAEKTDTTRSYVTDSKLTKIMWDIIGEHLVNRIKSNFGANNQGYIKINPLINPLYMGYSHRRGLTYKLDVRGSYDFSHNSDLWVRIKAGYSFTQHQLYYTIPLMLYFDKRRNRYLQMEFGNGNRITNSTVADKIDNIDTVKWDKSRLYFFKDTNFKIINNFDISNKFGFQIGFIYHKRTAVDMNAFDLANRPPIYRSFAPIVEIEYRPKGWNGPIFTVDYERSIKNVAKTNTAYERWEIDGQYLKHLTRLQSISMRLGAGFYTWKGKDSFFLDYANFRENNIPGGWNDDWSGEFELLDSKWYNESEYYARANLTYETPLLVTGWIPQIGHFIEMERVYISALSVKNLTPYIECGYGFTNRLFSIGIFVSTKNGNFNSFGCKFGFELFRHW